MLKSSGSRWWMIPVCSRESGDISEDYRYLIMDKAERIHDISHVWDYFQVNNNDELFHVMKLRTVSEKYNLLINDFGRVVNWGSIDGRPMIIDYGFTRQVRRRFYAARSVATRKKLTAASALCFRVPAHMLRSIKADPVKSAVLTAGTPGVADPSAVPDQRMVHMGPFIFR